MSKILLIAILNSISCLIRDATSIPNSLMSSNLYGFMDNIAHKAYFGHHLDRCAVMAGEFSAYSPYSHHNKNDRF